MNKLLGSRCGLCGWDILIFFLRGEKFIYSLYWVGKVKALYAFDAWRVALCGKAEYVWQWLYFILSFLFRKETKQRKAQLVKALPAICRLTLVGFDGWEKQNLMGIRHTRNAYANRKHSAFRNRMSGDILFHQKFQVSAPSRKS